MRHRHLAVFLGLLETACASYAARSVPILQPTAYGHRQTTDGITIAADPYATEQKYRSVFDTAPTYERGYLGINILVFNDSERALSLDPANVLCVTSDGTEHSMIPSTQVAEQVLRSTTGRYLAGGIMAAGLSKGANDRIRADFDAKGLKAQELQPGGRSQGFVFCPNDTPLHAVRFRGLRHGADSGLLVTIPLPPDLPLHRQ